jgi:hypothetical protein
MNSKGDTLIPESSDNDVNDADLAGTRRCWVRFVQQAN